MEALHKIKIHKLNKGLYFQKGRFGQAMCKLEAMRDITKECGKDKFFTQNYICIEYKVLLLNKYPFEIIELNTNLY